MARKREAGERWREEAQEKVTRKGETKRAARNGGKTKGREKGGKKLIFY